MITEATKPAMAPDKGKQPAVVEAEGRSAAEEGWEDEEGPDGEDEEEESDMELAWQMLEVARTIYAAAGPAYAPQLAGIASKLLNLGS